MCEQSSVVYAHGDVVWCKLGSCWWPGEIFDLNRLPPEVLAGFKKPPIAAVRFFQEDKYEYVRNLDHIYHYNCRRKNEFIKKGLDMHRASVKHMDKFPIDVCTAEKLTNGDPDIITSEEFGPNKRVSYSNLFGTPANKKPSNRTSLSGNRTPRRNKNSTTPRTTPKSTPIKSTPRSYNSGDGCSPASNPFNCQFCDFVTGRLNVIVIHNKSHFSGELPIIKNRKTKSSVKASTSGKKRVCKMTPSNTSSIDEDLLLLSRGVDLATYNGSTTSIIEIPLEDNRKRKSGRADMKTTKKQKTVDIRENLLADWADDSDIEADMDASSKTITDLDVTRSESESKNEKKDMDSEAKEKSCFDFEDEEEEATIIHKSPGRKIPRVIPENQKNLNTDYNFPDVVLSPDIVSKNSSKDKVDDNIINDSISEDQIEKNVSAVLLEKTIPETVDDKNNVESIEEEFTNLMEQTSLPELPTLDSLKKLKRKRSKAKSTERERSLQKSVHDEKLDSVSEAEFEKFEKKFESESKNQVTNVVDTVGKNSFENGSEKTEMYNENNILDSAAKVKSKLISVDDLNSREHVHMPSEYSLLDENLLESNDSEKENDGTSVSFDEKSDEFTKDMISDDSKNEIKEKITSTEDISIDVRPSMEPISDNKSIVENEIVNSDNISKDDNVLEQNYLKQSDQIINDYKTDEDQDVDKNFKLEEDFKNDENYKTSNEDKIDVFEKMADNEIDKIEIEESKMTSQNEVIENIQEIENEKTDEKDVKMSELCTSDGDLETKFNKFEEACKKTISNDFNIPKLELDVDITKECLTKMDENKEQDNENASVYSNEDITTSLVNDVTEEFKTKDTSENFGIIPDPELNPCNVDTEVQVSNNKKVSDDSVIADDIKPETIIDEGSEISTRIETTVLESDPTVESLTYTEESEFDSIENEIQRITSAGSSPCKTNSFPENIATVPMIENQISEIESSVDTKNGNKSIIDCESDLMKNNDQDNTLESEIAKLTHSKLDESEIVPTSKYSTSSSKLLEILTESKANTEKSKLNLDEYSLVEVSETPKKGFPTAAAKKHGASETKSTDTKTTKFVIKSNIQGKESSQKKSCKPIILSEEIIKPADDVKKVSVQKVITKRSYEDIEDIDTFIIKKPLKSFVDNTQKTVETVTESGKRALKTKSSIVSHSSSDRTSDKSVVDDGMFDINSMPIVLSDDLLTPENIQNMPIMITGLAGKETGSDDKHEKTAGHTPKTGSSNAETVKSPLKTSLRSVVQQGLSKNQKVYQTGSTKLLQNKPAVITQPGKPGKFIILGSSSSPNATGSKYTVGKRTKILTTNQTSVVLNKNHPIVSDVSAVDVDQKVGNKVMLLTHSQGQQSHIVLSPAQQKLLSSKIGANVVAKGATTLRPKGKVLSTHSIVTSKSNVVSLGPPGSKLQTLSPQTVVASKGQLLMPVHGQSIITSKGQILTPVHTDRMKSMKTVTQAGKRIQKIILPALSSNKVKHGLTEIKSNTVVVRGKQALKKLQPNILSGTPIARPPEHIISKSGQTLTLSSPATAKSKIIPSRTTPQASTKHVLRGPTGTQKIVFQKVSSASETQGRQQRTIPTKIQKSCPSPKQDVRSPTSNNVSVPPLVPLSPGHSKTNEPNVVTTSIGHVSAPGLTDSNIGGVETKGAERQALKQIILQDEMGNQTTVTQGQILAVPDGESADGQGQFYVLVTVDESGNLLPLDNQALMALDPSIVGQDGNVVLQFNQAASREQKVLPDETIIDSSRTEIDGSSDIPTIDSQRLSLNERRTITTPAETTDHDLILSDAGAAPLERITGADTISEPQNVTYSISSPGSNQQIIISGDSENAQQILNALASGNQDLSKLISGAEGNFIIDADRQQILLDASGGDQIILTAPGDGLQLQESYCTDFVTQVTTNQDILAEALANTDVFQQEHAISDAINVVNNRTAGSLMSTTSRLSPSLYQNMQLPNLTPSTVLETSLTTLGPPIMSPLEVPSNGNSKKLSSDLDVESDLGTQIPKSLQLPITITDPNISQTVSQQSQLSSDLTKSLGLPITITDPNISSVGMSDLTSSAFNYSLPTLDDSPDFTIESTPVTVNENENKGPISMPLLTDESELPTDDVRNRVEDGRIETDGLGEIFDSRSDESRECAQESDKLVDNAGTALDVLASVTTTEIINTRANTEIKSDQTTPDPTELQAAHRTIEDNLELRHDDAINESDMLRTDDRIGGDHSEINESARTVQERFVLESPENEIDSNSDEIALQPPITGEAETDLDTRIEDVDESFAECVLENGEMIKKTSFDDVS